jgi:hypothetical protein
MDEDLQKTKRVEGTEHGPVDPKRLRLRDYSFGFASADFEASHDPNLLLRGFVDPMNLVGEAKDGRRWLFLGYKGSGKSALGEHLRLVAEDDPHSFVRFVNIADVSFSTFSQILKGQLEPEARYPTVWSWLLLLFLFDSFSDDQGSNLAREDDLYLAIEGLKELGLLPRPKLNEAVTATSDKSFSLKLTTVLGGIEAGFKTSKTQGDLPFFADRLRLIARRFSTESKHLLVIDGFDDLLRRGHLQYDALGALIFEANRLNLDFAGAGLPAKILVLCRTDLFERLPGANKNKIRQNAAVHIDWTCDTRDAKTSKLIDLINRRAGLSLGRGIDVFEYYLPRTLQPSGRGDIRLQLLGHTRHVPRDMVMLFKSLQEHSGEGPMTPHQVGNALTAYSRDYLLPEIKDELDGYIEGNDINTMFQALGAIRKVSPTIHELEEHVQALHAGSSFALDKILSALFECSAIGNLLTSRSTQTVFKYCNRHSAFNWQERIMVHEGLWRALNLRW